MREKVSNKKRSGCRPPFRLQKPILLGVLVDILDDAKQMQGIRIENQTLDMALGHRRNEGSPKHGVVVLSLMSSLISAANFSYSTVGKQINQ